MKDNEITSEDLDRLVSIASGLLASGHYTKLNEKIDDVTPSIRREDFGKDWKEDGYIRRWQSYVADDACSILRELKESLPPEQTYENKI